MEFKQYYLGCLSHASYLIGSAGEAAIVDPQRDVDQYIEDARVLGLNIRYVVETHLHADFVSGHRELAERTGAQIIFGAAANAEFPHIAVCEGDEFNVGSVRLSILETPGHTPESISIIVTDDSQPGRTPKVLTGDTLFVGDVGRPDLAAARGLTREQMAEMLYDSLHQKLLALPDDTEVYPAHGAGSLCGKNISKETSSTIGQQRRFNHALQPMSRQDFVRMMTTDLPEAPSYFAYDAELNRRGPGALSKIPAPMSLSAAQVHELMKNGTVVLDVRSPEEFGKGHVPGSINIGLGGQFASWAGTLLDPAAKLILVATDAKWVSEAVMRLARVGFENVEGFLEDGVEGWIRGSYPLTDVEQISVRELELRRSQIPGLQIVDVRRAGEFESGHVPSAKPMTLSCLAHLAPALDPARPTAVICASGYRSSIGTSLLGRLGFVELMNVTGGTAAWVQAGLPTVTETALARADTLPLPAESKA